MLEENEEKKETPEQEPSKATGSEPARENGEATGTETPA